MKRIESMPREITTVFLSRFRPRIQLKKSNLQDLLQANKGKTKQLNSSTNHTTSATTKVLPPIKIMSCSLAFSLAAFKACSMLG